MKTLLVLGDSRFGGATYLILSWCKFLLEKGCEVVVLSTDQVTIAEFEKLPGIRIINTILIPRDIAPGADLKALWQLTKLIAKEQFTIVHTHTSTPGFIGRLAAWFAQTPVRLHTAHGWSVSEFSSPTSRLLFTPLEYLAALLSTRVICVSHATSAFGRFLHLAPQSRLVTVCNGIDPRPFLNATDESFKDQARKRLGLSSFDLVFGNISRLSAQKDNETLIRAMRPFKSLFSDISFVILLVGDGPERKRLEQLVKTLGIEREVYFCGFRRDVPDILAALDVFVSPSLWEGLSISMLEAMAAAKPIVATNILPNAELIEHEVTGLLVPPKNPEEVAKAVARFVNDPDLAQRCGMAARQRVLERYTIERMFQETWDLYVQLLKEKGYSEG